MNYIKTIIKKVTCVFIRLLLPIVSLLKCKVSYKKLAKYEEDVQSLYQPKPYLHKNYFNKPIDNSIDLSIIIPIYNCEKYLSKCIDSILDNKTKYNYEIICVNDGSTDKSLSIIEAYNNDKIKIFNKSNGGAAAARNTGLDNASGKYVAFIDSDDYVSNNFIDKLLDIAYNNKSDIVKCGFYKVYNKKLEKHNGIIINTKEGLNEEILKIDGFLWMCIIKRD